MAETFTPNLRLSKFAQGERPPILSAAKLNENWTKTDLYITAFGLNVKAKGAIGDGDQDDTEAIQEAFNSGKHVLLFDGTFKVTSKLTLPDYDMQLIFTAGSVIDASSADFLLFESAYDRVYKFSGQATIKGSGNVGSKFFAAEAGSASGPGIIMEDYFIVRNFEIMMDSPNGTGCFAFLRSVYWLTASLTTALHARAVQPGNSVIFAFHSNFISEGGGEWGTGHGGFEGGISFEAIGEHVNLYTKGEFAFFNVVGVDFGYGSLKFIGTEPSQSIVGCYFVPTKAGQLNWIDNTGAAGSEMQIANTLFVAGGDMTEVIKTDKSRCRLLGVNFQGVAGAQNTFKEINSADYNELVGCVNLGDGGGPTIIGANTRINGSLDRNVVDFGADPTGTNDSAPAFSRAIAASGKRIVADGTFKVNSMLTFPDRDVDIQLAPGTTIDIGNNVITLFKVPTGLTEKRRYRVIGGKKIIGGNVAGQTLVEQADSNSRGVINFVDVALISDFRTILNQSAGALSFVQDSVVRAFFTRCKIVPPTDGSVLLKTASAAGTYGYPAAAHFEDCPLWSEIAPGQKGWTFSYDGDILCKGYVSGTFKGTCKCDGLNTSGPVFALNGATADGTDSLEALGVTYDSGDEIGNAFLDNIILKFSANSFLIKGPGLSSRSKLILNASTLSVVNPRLFFSLADPDVRIDVLAGADNCEVIGGHLGNATTALIRTAADGLRVADCDLDATGNVKTILESGAADGTSIVNCTGLGTGGGPTIIGPRTKINGSLERNVTDFGADPTGAASSMDAIRAALESACPTAGDQGTVVFEAGTYLWDETLEIGDIEPSFIFKKGAKLIHTGLGANPAIKFLDGLTAVRKPLFVDMESEGNDSATDSLFELNDEGSLCKPLIIRPQLKEWRTVVDIVGADLTYAEPVRVRFEGGRIFSPNAASPLIKTPDSAGTYGFGAVVEFIGTSLDDDQGSSPGWTIDFDGDLILHDIIVLRLGGDSAVDGFQPSGTSWLGGSSTITQYGANYWSTDQGDIGFSGTVIFKVSNGGFRVVLANGASILVNGVAVEIDISITYPNVVAAIAVDIPTGMDYARITGLFGDHATAAIRTAATKGSFSCRFKSTGAHKTVQELAGADYNVAAGCSGLAAGGGVTVVGANSRYDTTIANSA